MKTRMPLFSRQSALQLSAGFICVVSLICAGLIQRAAAEDAQPLPPPVDMEFTSESVSGANEGTLLIRLRVIPQKDMHVDIACLLPDGVEPVPEGEVSVRPYEDRQSVNEERQAVYHEALGLWTGLLKAGEVKEFSFRVKASVKERYELIARAEALAQWGAKEEILIIHGSP